MGKMGEGSRGDTARFLTEHLLVRNDSRFMTKKFRTYTDGGARGNPGPAGIGAVIQQFDETDQEYRTVRVVKRYLGETTNNQAEYRALIAALEAATELGATEAECLLDSELVVRQLNGEYRVKDPELAPLFLKIWNLGTGFQKISYQHIRREYNKEADKLVNEAIDEHLRNGV